MSSDSPCPSSEVAIELNRIRAYLKKHGISARKSVTRSSNVFMVKRWLVANPGDVSRGRKLVKKYLETTQTNHLHEAE
jgi:hypothetical protein